MSEPFLGQITIVAFNFAPRNFALCDGQLLPINQNQSLFSILGTTYGGDGRTSFALPDLRGRTPNHEGTGYNRGQKAGVEGHRLTTGEIPPHTHGTKGTTANAGSSNPANSLLGVTSGGRFSIVPYANLTNPQSLLPTTVANNPGGQPHNNMQPYLVLNYCIALQGLFPSRN
jgi:microcystin-dependent protein